MIEIQKVAENDGLPPWLEHHTFKYRDEKKRSGFIL